MSIRSATSTLIIQSAAAAAALNPPRHFLEVLTDTPKVAQGTTFLKSKQTAFSKGNAFVQGIIMGSRDPLNVRMSNGASIFGDEAGPKGGKPKAASFASIATLLSDYTEIDRSALEVVEHDFLEGAARPDVQKFWPYFGQPGRAPQVTCHIKRNYGFKCKDPAKRGKPRPPLVEFKIGLTNYPANFGALSGKPRTTVFDWSTRRLENKQEVFDQRLDAEGKPLNAENCAQILAAGDVIRRIEVVFDSVSAHDAGISLRMVVYRIWTERVGQTSDYLETDEESALPPPEIPVAAPAAAAAAVPVAGTRRVPGPKPIGDDEEGDDGVYGTQGEFDEDAGAQ
jgi:hypothetical protein